MPQVVVAGGGPAGMMLGYLLARAGVEVAVLEKHADFLRDFRGDTIHPATLQLMQRLGLREALLALPHQRVHEVRAYVGDRELRVVDYSHLAPGCNFLAYMPQWEFLDFLAREAERFAAFRLHRQWEALELVREGRRVVGLRVRTPSGERDIAAGLVVAADGRDSRLRQLAGLPVRNLGAPMDVLWFRLPHREGDPSQAFACVRDGVLLAMIDRGSYWQCALNIPKDSFDALRAEGLARFRARLRAAAPFLDERAETLEGWQDVRLLHVRVERATRWYCDGLLCIGDAAHAMSQVGGIGINLAIADALAAARILAPRLQRGDVARPRDLRAVQRRREWPVLVAQQFQRIVQNRAIAPVLASRHTPRVPLGLRLLDRSRPLRRLAGRMIGLGARSERPPEF